MQNTTNSDGNERHIRRSVSLEPRMSSPQTEDTNGATIQLNPLFGTNQLSEERNSSLRRHVSEPARNHNRIVSNIVTRAESIRSMVMRGTQQFFGISEDQNSDDQLWRQRGRRLLSKHGKIKESVPGIGIESTGFDETDGHFHSNQRSSSPENQRPVVSDTEDSSRSPALKVTFKAIALASNTLKKKMANRNRRIQTEDGFSDIPTDLPLQSAPIHDQFDDELEDDFFVNEGMSHETDEVDSNTRPNMWTIQRQVSVRDKSIPQKFIETLLKVDNSNRRELGLGFIDTLLDRRLKKNLSKEQRKAIDDHIDDFRPYFTYWLITVQILILLISLFVYGFGKWGFGFAHIEGLVYLESRSLQQVDYYEPENFWFGPRSADLIHLGAKYTPCMRRDQKIFEIIQMERDREKSTGCCIRNDGSGCVQTFRDRCSPLLSTWHKWGLSEDRSSGPVCGQDPFFCQQPASIEPYEWADDITKWPICRKKTTETALSAHMKCELIARPCCLGVYGQCHITTRDYCDFIKGFFHEEATLCSQVSCMKNVCGMIPFYSEDSPDQFYRIWTPIFLHAGFGHLLISVLFQYFIMRDIEKMSGPFRMAIIYMLSGIGGYLASAVFLPFRPEVGPAGSLYGVLATLFAEVINLWEIYEDPIRPLLKLILVACVLFLLGLLPWIDNYAHIVGFVIGFLLSLALIPDVTLPIQSRQSQQNTTERQHKRTLKILQIVICLGSVVLILITLFVMLYKAPIYDIAFFKYLNCIPFTSDWCANQDIQINRVDIL